MCGEGTSYSRYFQKCIKDPCWNNACGDSDAVRSCRSRDDLRVCTCSRGHHPVRGPDGLQKCVQGESQIGYEFPNQGVLKVAAKGAPPHIELELGNCYTFLLERAEKRSVLSSTTEQVNAELPGDPKPDGGFIMLLYHTETNVVANADYELMDGDWGNVRLQIPINTCKISSINVHGSPPQDFNELRMFASSDAANFLKGKPANLDDDLLLTPDEEQEETANGEPETPAN